MLGDTPVLNDGNGRRKGKAKSTGRPKVADTWGPPDPSERKKDGGIGQGSTEDREVMLRTKRMARVMEGRDEEITSALDANGKFKRRTSTDELRPGSSHDDDFTLVYIHLVQKSDTLQGVILKYSCKPDVFRKANRFWPNDSIQMRERVILPIDACAIKGRPCDPPSKENPSQGVDLLAPTPEIETPPFPISTNDNFPSLNGTSAARPEDDENPWVHVRWVLLDNSPSAHPVEIARMPRKTLGYFPPRRRKSTLSSISTPRGSGETLRLGQTVSQTSNEHSGSTASTPARRTSNLGPRPGTQALSSISSYFPPLPMSMNMNMNMNMGLPRKTRPRRESVDEAADRLGWMRGPGGVGTLGKNVRKPGPGQDGLNSWAKKLIPGLAIDGLPSTSVMGSETAHFGFLGGGEELPSIAEGVNGTDLLGGSGIVSGSANQGMGLENAAAAIEGWVRRLAIKGPGTPLGGGRVENPDLIELLDGTGSDDGRGFELSPGRVRSSTPVGTGREDLDGVLRGRQSAGMKGGKSD
jgi:hypothetical protein